MTTVIYIFGIVFAIATVFFFVDALLTRRRVLALIAERERKAVERRRMQHGVASHGDFGAESKRERRVRKFAIENIGRVKERSQLEMQPMQSSYDFSNLQAAGREVTVAEPAPNYWAFGRSERPRFLINHSSRYARAGLVHAGDSQTHRETAHRIGTGEDLDRLIEHYLAPSH